MEKYRFIAVVIYFLSTESLKVGEQIGCSLGSYQQASLYVRQ